MSGFCLWKKNPGTHREKTHLHTEQNHQDNKNMLFCSKSKLSRTSSTVHTAFAGADLQAITAECQLMCRKIHKTARSAGLWLTHAAK